MRHVLPITVAFLLTAASALAQVAPTAVAVDHAPVYVVPDTSRTPLRTAAQGTTFVVVAEEGDWTRVQFKDPQWGLRVGYVETRLLRFNRPELTPMDLSVERPVAPHPSVTHRRRPRARHPSHARGRAASGFERGFIDVNFGVAWASEDAGSTSAATSRTSSTA